MPVLTKTKHELFAQGICRNLHPVEAYVNAGFSPNGADASANRLQKSAKVAARIAELQEKSANLFVTGQIRERTYRVAVLEDMLDRMRRLIEARAIDMKDVPGGDTGLLVRSFKSFGSAVTKISGEGQNMTERSAPDVREEYKFDAALAHEIREFTKEAGIEMGQRSEKQEVTLKAEVTAAVTDYSKVPLETLLAAREKLLEAQRMMLTAAPGSVEDLGSEVKVGDDAA